jgi:uncharacterized protein (TIGR00290 family)
MIYALMSGGGKESVLALDRARRIDLDVKYLANIYDGSSKRVRPHGVPHTLIERQARHLGLKPILDHIKPDDFETVFVRTLQKLKDHGVSGVICGNIHLEQVRAWYEDRVTATGLEHLEPLWGEPPIELAWEVVERGYQALVVSVDLRRPAAPFLGRELDADLVTELGCTDDLDPCGEHGEYYTFVYDGPAFGRAVDFNQGERSEVEGYAFVDLVTAARGK